VSVRKKSRGIALVTAAFAMVLGLLIAPPAMAAPAASGQPVPSTDPAVTVVKTVDRPDELYSFVLDAVVSGIDEPGTTTKYQWYRVNLTTDKQTAIKGATSSTYRPKAADYPYGILVRAIVSKSGFESLTLYSAVRDYSLRIDPAMPLEFINDEPHVGMVVNPAAYNVRHEKADGSGYEVFAATQVDEWKYAWYRSGKSAKVGSLSTYTAVAADLGRKLHFRVWLWKSGYLPIVGEKSPTTEKVVKGTFDVGTTNVQQDGMVLRVDPAASDPTASRLSVQWYRDGKAVKGKTKPTYTLTSADFGKEVTARITYRRSGYVTETVTAQSTGTNRWYLGASPERPEIYGVTDNDVHVGATLKIGPRNYENTHLETALDTEDPSQITLAYQWYRSGKAIPAPLGTGPTYTLTAADKGKTITVKVTATDPNGLLVRNVATSVATKAIGTDPIPGAGTASVSVEQDPGTLTLGAAVTGLAADETLRFAYQWYRGSTAIKGATKQTYTLGSKDRGKKVWVRVTVSKPASGSTTYTSMVYNSDAIDYTVQLGDPLPYMSGNSWSVGTQIGIYGLNFITKDGPLASPTIKYQWLRNGKAIAGADLSYYFLDAADYRAKVAVRLTVSSPGYVDLVYVVPAPYPIAKGMTTEAPASLVVPAGDGKLQAVADGTLEPATPAPKYSYQWYRGNSKIKGATKAIYTLTSADRGKQIWVRITMKRKNFVAATQILTDSPGEYHWIVATPEKPAISGTPQVDSLLTAVAPEYTDAETGAVITPALSYQWYRSGKAISGATASTYSPVVADIGKRISVKVTARAPGLLAHSATSASTATVTAGTIDPGTASLMVSGIVGQYPRVLAEVVGSVATPGVTYEYQWYRHTGGTLDSPKTAIKGATAETYTLTDADSFRLVSLVVTLRKTGYAPLALDPIEANVMGYSNNVMIAGTFAAGEELSAQTPELFRVDNETANGGDIVFEWRIDGEPIADSDSPSYIVQESDLGHAITVRVTLYHEHHAPLVLESAPAA